MNLSMRMIVAWLRRVDGLVAVAILPLVLQAIGSGA